MSMTGVLVASGAAAGLGLVIGQLMSQQARVQKDRFFEPVCRLKTRIVVSKPLSLGAGRALGRIRGALLGSANVI